MNETGWCSSLNSRAPAALFGYWNARIISEIFCSGIARRDESCFEGQHFLSEVKGLDRSHAGLKRPRTMVSTVIAIVPAPRTVGLVRS
jgi:hypothetical protein